MPRLTVTLIDVGAGDSLFIEAEDRQGATSYALIDSNDEPNWRSTEIFLLRHLQRRQLAYGSPNRLFEFVLLTHAHSDHMSGLKRLLQELGTEWFYYPESAASVEFANLIAYVTRSANLPNGRVRRHQIVNNQTQLPPLGDASLHVLWPPPTPAGQPYDPGNPNNNSVVLGIRLDRVKLLLSGDCEAPNWPQILPSIRPTLRFFKVPHHGAHNGLFDNQGNAVWNGLLNAARTYAGLSTHISPHGHPDANVIQALEAAIGGRVYRTDNNYHVTFETRGRTEKVKFSRF
ncbi:MAG TPA: MBL fold metallo-hydrolase [Myxococcota bacterium]|nr:MBL fold metallo-hydrolase [Myxococcota bacterium]